MKKVIIVAMMLLVSFGIVFSDSKEQCKKEKEKCMVSDAVKDAVVQVVSLHFQGLKEHDFTKVSSAWHKNGKMFVGIDMQEVSFFAKIPPFINFEVDSMEVLSIDNKIAVVKVMWRMIMPESVGYHNSYINLSEETGKWLIISKTDFGEEKKK